MMPAIKLALASAAHRGTPVTTWNPLDIGGYSGPYLIFSNGNLTIESDTGTRTLIRSTNSKSTGKLYFEYVVNQSGNICNAGISQSSGTPSSAFNGGFGGPGGSSGTIHGIAIDIGNNKAWVHTNGVYASGDPSTGASPSYTGPFTTPLMPMAQIEGGYGNAQISGRFQSSQFTYAIPTGFTSWDGN